MSGLDNHQIQTFYDQGYLLVKGLLNPITDLDPIIDEYHGVLDTLARELYAFGEIESTYAELPFSERLIQIYQETGTVHNQHFNICLPRDDIQHDSPIWVGPAIFNAIRNERLLDAVESLIGGEIFSNPIQHIRMKPPEHRTPLDPETGDIQLGQTPWHQDASAVLPEADETQLITTWTPLWDAPIESGCLQVIPGSHRAGLTVHCPHETRQGTAIPAALMRRQDARPIPMMRGDVLFLTRFTQHASLPNRSNKVRWSLDLRYNPVGQSSGRRFFPGFIARSRQYPQAELRDPKAWAALWYNTRRRLADSKTFIAHNRWSAEHPACA